MAKSRCRSRRSQSAGFSVIEVLIAMVIFAIGLLSLAALMFAVNLNTERSRYVGTATLLASEKLEDLNRYSVASTDTAVTPGGSLSSDIAGYNDDVQVQADNGTITEVTYDADTSCYEVFTHSIGSNLTVPATASSVGDTSCGTPPTLPNAMGFHRQWLVESPIMVGTNSVNVHRITVLVTSRSSTFSQGKPLTFQISTVRP